MVPLFSSTRSLRELKHCSNDMSSIKLPVLLHAHACAFLTSPDSHSATCPLTKYVTSSNSTLLLIVFRHFTYHVDVHLHRNDAEKLGCSGPYPVVLLACSTVPPTHERTGGEDDRPSLSVRYVIPFCISPPVNARHVQSGGLHTLCTTLVPTSFAVQP